MKKFRSLLPLVLAACVCAPISIQANSKGDGASPPSKEDGERAPRRAGLPGLTEAENKKVLAAIEKAQNEPSVVKAREEFKKTQEDVQKLDPNERRAKLQEARKKFMDVVRVAAIKMDPSVEALFKKSDAARKKALERNS